jgi:hypothetical protein
MIEEIPIDTLFIEWVEPVECRSETLNRVVKMSISDAIKIQKEVAAEKGHIYKTNMDALYDAIATNWATLIEEIKTDDRNAVVNRRILDIQADLCEEINRGRR